MIEALNSVRLSFLKSGATSNLCLANQLVSAAEGSRGCEPRSTNKGFEPQMGAKLLRSAVRLSPSRAPFARLFPGG
jgi:hypothetical protein